MERARSRAARGTRRDIGRSGVSRGAKASGRPRRSGENRRRTGPRNGGVVPSALSAIAMPINGHHFGVVDAGAAVVAILNLHKERSTRAAQESSDGAAQQDMRPDG